MAAMNQVLDSVGSLAAMPATVLKVCAMVTGGGASIAEIEKVIRTDEALSMTVLRVANSARYGQAGRSFTLREGIVRLGLQALRSLVLEQQASSLFARAGAAYDLQRGALWRSAVGGAIAAETLARRARFAGPDLAFICGLLRDVGKLAFEAHYGSEYRRKVTRHTRESRTFVEAERDAFGFDHAQLGAALARRWQLPDRIADAIGMHHDPPADAGNDLLFDLVHAADIITLWAGLAVGVDGLRYRVAEHVRVGLSLDRTKAEALIADVWLGVRDAEATVMAECMGEAA